MRVPLTYPIASPVATEQILALEIERAALLGAGRDLGTLEPGKLADLVIVDGNPLEDITHTRRVRAVVKNGEVFTIETLLAGVKPSS